MKATNGELWPCTRKEYDGHRALRSSSFRRFLFDGPQDYYYWHVDPAPERTITEDMLFGQHFHSAALENEITWEVAEPCSAVIESKRSNRYGEECGHPGITKDEGEWRCGKHSSNPPLSSILSKDLDYQLRGMLASLHNHEEAFSLVGHSGFEEHAIKFKLDGTPCKALLDRLQHDGTIIDLKTIRGHTEWMLRDAIYGESAKKSYYVQAAWYTLAREAVFPNQYAPFVIVFVSKQAPYPTICVELPQEAIDAGKRAIAEGLVEFKDRWKRKDWSHRYGAGRVTIPPPAHWEEEHRVRWAS